MVDKMCILVLTSTLIYEGQLTKTSISETVRHIAEKVTNLRLTRILSEFTGEIVSDSLNMVANLPIAIARKLDIGSGYSLPILLSDRNKVDLTNSIVDDFNIGRDTGDAGLSITELITKYKYPVENHEAKTDDGYILSMFRIPSNGTVVFLMHGLLGSADDYMVGGPDNGLALLLAEEGYDVWMGNARGNKHSRRHATLHPSEAAFWDFSWHEIGFYDLPAMIDYVLNVTGSKSLTYIGHSQGATSFFVMASERPKYNEKISLMIALSPVAFMGNARSPVVRLLSPGGDFIHAATKILGVYEFMPNNAIMGILMRAMCGSGPLAELLCSNAIFLVAGFSIAQLDVKHLPAVFGHVPSGSSVKQLAHYGQGVISKDFRQFDYGVAENLRSYKRAVPPSYELGNVVAPVALFYSDADWLAHTKDVSKLYHKLGNVVEAYKVPFKDFNHLDFIWAKDIVPLVYERVRKLIRSTSSTRQYQSFIFI